MFKKISFAIIALIFFLLLFIDAGPLLPERIIDALWPIGHVAVFAFWSFLLLRHQPTIKNYNLKKQLLTLTLFCFSFGLMIEFIQPFFGRSKETGDLFMNYIGVLLSILIVNYQRIHPGIKIAYLALLGYLLTPSALIIYDQAKLYHEFPVLASFQQNIALTRWKADQPLVLVQPEQNPGGENMMQITFAPRKYSGAALRYFKSDWQGYKTLIMHFYNANPETLPVTLIITDKHYDKGKPNNRDRFNKKLEILPGFNEIKLPLATIKEEVKLRDMDLGQMAGIDFYMYELNAPVHLYLHTLYLK